MIAKIVGVKLLHVIIVIIGFYLLIMWRLKGVVIYKCMGA